jgi:ribose transport system substrate-binding protein
VQAGIPVITFDSDAPNSKRIVYIGTDNYFGVQPAKVLKQVGPIIVEEYMTVGSLSPNLVKGVRF